MLDFRTAAVVGPPADEPTTFRVLFFTGEPENNWAAKSEAAELTIRLYDNNDPRAGQAREVTLRVEAGMTASLLQRFPWGKWLTAADAYTRMQETDPVSTALLSADAKRPGRRGHDPDFLPAIARRYDALRRVGERAPVRTIAHEHHVSRNTAAGWIKQARDKGLLPKARRPGKAG